MKSSNHQFIFDEENVSQPERKGKPSAHKRRKRNSVRLRKSVLAAGAFVLIAVVFLVIWTGFGKGLLPGKQAGSQPSAESTAGSQAASATVIETATSVTTAGMPTPAPTPDPVIRITLSGVGDIILHQAVIDGGLTNAGDKSLQYDYTPVFQYIKPILSASDLAMANFEGTLAGSPYSGYPFFCAPDAIADALGDAGIDAVWTANNHTIDKGLKGVVRTAATFREKGFRVIGTRPDETVPADAVVDISGVKIGLMAYTFETIGTESVKSLNGINMPAGADPLIDSFNPYREAAYERDIQALLDRSDRLREQGAELICLAMHWGDEYKTRSNAYQKKLAQRLCDAGIELIIGHHPHVLEEISVLTSSDRKRQTLVYYSIGNFLHNMDFNTHNTSGNAQDAVIARIHILKDAAGVRIESAEYIPTYVVRVAKGSGTQHLIVPVLPGLADPAAYRTTAKEMTASRDRIAAILADSKGSAEIPVTVAAQ